MPQIDYTIFFVLALWIFPIFFSAFYYALVYVYPIFTLWNKVALGIVDIALLKIVIFIKYGRLVNYKYFSRLN